MRLVGIITIAAALGACRPAAPLGSSTHPAWAPDGQTIAFISNREGVRSGLPINFEVYVSAVDGAGARRLTTNQEFEADLAWSPDGAHLLVKSSRDGNDEIYLLDRRGDVQRNLTNAPASDGGPSWSPDGRTIVFHSNRDGETRLYVMDADGANVRALPRDPGPGHSPQWSPDGSAIAFVSARDGNAEIYVVDADGANVRRLTDDPRENAYPRWSPDGTTLAHTAGRFDTDHWSIVVTDREGANGRILVDSTDSGNAAWSPDGARLLFGRYRIYGDGGGEESELHVLELASGTASKIHLTLPVTAADPSAPPTSAAAAQLDDSLMVDSRDGRQYRTVSHSGKVWFAANLNYASPDSYCYELDEAHCGRYGRLYRWEAALAVCPTGWHLSTDFEWMELELAVGMPFAELGRRGNRDQDEGRALKLDGASGFEAVFGGWRDWETGTFEAQGRNGAWWTATEADLINAWHRDIDVGDDMVLRTRVNKTYALSVRCVQNWAEFDCS